MSKTRRAAQVVFAAHILLIFVYAWASALGWQQPEAWSTSLIVLMLLEGTVVSAGAAFFPGDYPGEADHA